MKGYKAFNKGLICRGKQFCVKTEKIDGEKIKEDVWYRLKNGEFKEVE